MMATSMIFRLLNLAKCKQNKNNERNTYIGITYWHAQNPSQIYPIREKPTFEPYSTRTRAENIRIIYNGPQNKFEYKKDIRIDG